MWLYQKKNRKILLITLGVIAVITISVCVTNNIKKLFGQPVVTGQSREEVRAKLEKER